MADLETPIEAQTNEVRTVPENCQSDGQSSVLVLSLPSVDTGADDGDDAESVADGSSSPSAVASLRSGIYEHVEENGRTYNRFRQGKYMLPNDEQEQERLEIQHAMFLTSLGGKLHLAPLKDNFETVLDMGTGTGTWAMEMAQQYPSARVVGTDLSAIQPVYIPSNCRFQIGDLEDQWIFPEKFNFVHGRALLSCFKDPKAVFQSAYDALTPGGYLEMQDIIFPFQFRGEPPTESPLYKWFNIIDKGAAQLGRPWTNVPKYKTWFKEIGFEDVVETKFYWPLNKWPKEKYYKDLSVLAQANFLNGLEGLSLKVMGSMGWSPEQVREYLVGVKEDVRNTEVYCYCPISVVYGRKPIGGSGG